MKTIKVKHIKRRLFRTKRASTLANALLGILAALFIFACYGLASYIDEAPIEVNTHE